MKKKYFLIANIVDPHNSIEEIGGLIINKEKVSSENYDLNKNLKYNKYLLLQKGKKNYTFIIVE